MLYDNIGVPLNVGRPPRPKVYSRTAYRFQSMSRQDEWLLQKALVRPALTRFKYTLFMHTKFDLCAGKRINLELCAGSNGFNVESSDCLHLFVILAQLPPLDFTLQDNWRKNWRTLI